jgi:hypothetical protein
LPTITGLINYQYQNTTHQQPIRIAAPQHFSLSGTNVSISAKIQEITRRSLNGMHG